MDDRSEDEKMAIRAKQGRPIFGVRMTITDDEASRCRATASPSGT